jgi:hypothetical protein
MMMALILELSLSQALNQEPFPFFCFGRIIVVPFWHSVGLIISSSGRLKCIV